MKYMAGFALALLALNAAHAAGFDCSKASTPVEKTICADPALSQADGQMNDTYTYLHTYCRGIAARADLRGSQRRWLAAARKSYGSGGVDGVDRLAAAYRARNEALAQLLSQCNPHQGPVRAKAIQVDDRINSASWLFVQTDPPAPGWRINRTIYSLTGATPPLNASEFNAYLAKHKFPDEFSEINMAAVLNKGSLLEVTADGTDCPSDALRCSPYDMLYVFDLRTGRTVQAEELYTAEGMKSLSADLKKRLLAKARAVIARLPRKETEYFGYQYQGCMKNWTDYASDLAMQVNFASDGRMVFGLSNCSTTSPNGSETGDGQALDGISLKVALPELGPYLSAYGKSLLLGEGDVRAPVAAAPLACKAQGGLPLQRTDRDPAPGIQAAGGREQYLLLTRAGILWLWGVGTPVPHLVGESMAQADGGELFNAAIHRDGTLLTWSMDFHTDLGIGFVSEQANLRQLLALKKDGTAWSWIMGDKSATRLMADVKQVGFGPKGERLLLKQDGSLWALGGFSYPGESNYDENTPRLIGKGFTRLAFPGADLAYKADGSLWAWGQTLSRTFFMDYAGDQDYAKPVNIGSGFVNVKVGGSDGVSLAALKADGSLWMAQRHNMVTRPEPVGCGYVDMVYGNDYLLALKADGSLELWGNWDAQRTTERKKSFVTNDIGQSMLGRFGSHLLLGKGYTRIYQVGHQWNGPGGKALALRDDGTVWVLNPQSSSTPELPRSWFTQAPFPKDAHITH